MFKTQVIAITLSALAATATSTKLVGEHGTPKPEVLPIPYQSVGNSIPLQKFTNLPVIECGGVTLDTEADIRIVSECAVGRVGWLKL